MTCRCRIIVCASEPLKKRFIEPIFQAHIKKPDLKVIHCRSNKCDQCLNEYFDKSLQQNFNQLFLEQIDTLEMGRPNAIVSSPNLTIDDQQMKNMQDEVLKKFEEKKEYRKRYGFMQMNNGIYILGGYVVDAKTRQIKIPKHDYFFNNDNKELIPIPPLPGNGRMGFGLAATDDEKIIGVGGHDFNYEAIPSVTILDTHAEKLQWKNLPDMPNGTIGPGVSAIDNILFVIGGFDFIGRDILCHGDALSMDLDKKQWKILTDVNPPRARALVSMDDHTDPPTLIVAGGYNFGKKGKVIPYNKIEEYNMKKKKWNIISDIPNFKTTSGLSTKNNKLLLMNTASDTGELYIVKEYNLEARKWENSSDIKQSIDQPVIKKEASQTYMRD